MQDNHLSAVVPNVTGAAKNKKIKKNDGLPMSSEIIILVLKYLLSH